MGKASRTLGLLDSIVRARDDREVAEHALRIFSEVIPGDYYSAVYCAGDTLATDVYHPGTGWVGLDSPMATFLRKGIFFR